MLWLPRKELILYMAKKRANGEGNIRKRTDGTQGVGQAVDPHF